MDELVTIPKYYYDALLKIALLAEERAALKEDSYKKEIKLNEAVFALKRPELESEQKK